MRMILFFDLPTVSVGDRKAYATFRKKLIKEGFVMMQNSVYSKLLLNPTSVKLTRERIEKIKPPKGDVQILTITERQFAEIEYVVGQNQDVNLQSTDKIIIL